MSNITTESKNKKTGLGRGLGSLLGAAASQQETTHVSSQMTNQTAPVVDKFNETPENARIWNVQIDKLVPNYYQPRTHFDKEKLQELSNSIKESGVLQPIVARKRQNGSLEIIAGERRWRASQMAGLHEVPVIIKTFTDKEALEVAIVENIQRAELSPIEEAEAYQRLMDEFSMTQQQVAERVGKERATVANTLRLLTLPMIVRDMIAKDEISTGHAKVLLSLQDQSKIISMAKSVAKQKISVRKLEKMVAAEKQGIESSESSAGPSLDRATKLVAAMSEELQQALGTKVSIDYFNGKGKISIQFYSNDELTEIAERIKAGCKK
jgi:ParB family transcriptional regulator, chromosome partitioning protein